MADHGYQNFFFPNHENSQAKYFFYNLILKERAFEERKIASPYSILQITFLNHSRVTDDSDHLSTSCSSSLCYLVVAHASRDVTIAIKATFDEFSVINLPEDSRLRILKNRVVKSRISVNNSSSSRVKQKFQVTDHKELFLNGK